MEARRCQLTPEEKKRDGARSLGTHWEKKNLALRRNNDDFCGLRLKRNNKKKQKGKMSRSRRIAGFVRRRGPLAAHPS